MAQTILGMDIGSHDLRIIQMKDMQIQAFATAAMPDHLVKDGRIVAYNALGDLIRETVRENHLHGKAVAISLPGEVTYLKRSHLPKMTVQQLKVNLPFEFHDYISGNVDQYVYDYALIGMEENSMDLMAAAIPAETVEAYTGMIRRAGLRLVRLVPDVLAIQSILMKSSAAAAGKKDFAVLDIGHSATRMHFYSGGQYEITRTLDTGSRQLAGMIAEAKNIDIHIAQLQIEQDQDGILEQDGSADYLDQMSTEIMRVMNFYSYNNPGNGIDCLYYFGSGLHMARLKKLIHDTTELEVKPLVQLIPSGSIAVHLGDGPAAYGAVTE
jgi:type IV pilus assembly protein PilM